jgi:hypothetical protein
MIAIVSLLIVLFLSLTVTRLATAALVHTGMSEESAKLQARSALSGCGFTTSESENMVNHPVRRRILLVMMLLGNIGIVATMSSVILSAMKNSEVYDQLWVKFSILIPGLLLLWHLMKSEWFSDLVYTLFLFMLRRMGTDTIPDYIPLCHLDNHFKIVEIYISDNSRIKGHKVSDVISDAIRVLGLKNVSGDYMDSPPSDTVISSGNTLILYGQTEAIDKLLSPQILKKNKSKQQL